MYNLTKGLPQGRLTVYRQLNEYRYVVKQQFTISITWRRGGGGQSNTCKTTYTRFKRDEIYRYVNPKQIKRKHFFSIAVCITGEGGDTDVCGVRQREIITPPTTQHWPAHITHQALLLILLYLRNQQPFHQ
ncbi:hypothetical protein J6590_085785 [Homalodisca vitripennis]|nr:hypothetical protein J6590_085785 [Homalodisca vitripennis]